MDQWQDFLKELVPPGLSNLFFFDGEKIKDILRQKGKIDQYIKEALGALLGLDTIEQLQSDLKNTKLKIEQCLQNSLQEDPDFKHTFQHYQKIIQSHISIIYLILEKFLDFKLQQVTIFTFILI